MFKLDDVYLVCKRAENDDLLPKYPLCNGAVVIHRRKDRAMVRRNREQNNGGKHFDRLTSHLI